VGAFKCVCSWFYLELKLIAGVDSPVYNEEFDRFWTGTDRHYRVNRSDETDSRQLRLEAYVGRIAGLEMRLLPTG